MKKFLLCILVLLAMHVCVYADTPPPPPVPYKIELDNGGRVFYMTPAGTADDEQLKSGLYEPAVSGEAIYTLNEYFYRGELYLSGDGIYFAHIPVWVATREQMTPLSETCHPAIRFYENSAPLRSYWVEELVSSLANCYYTVSHVTWDLYDNRVVDAENKILTVVTKEDVEIKFDMVTGYVITDEGNSNNIAIIICLSVASVIVIIELLRKRKRSNAVDCL